LNITEILCYEQYILKLAAPRAAFFFIPKLDWRALLGRFSGSPVGFLLFSGYVVAVRDLRRRSIFLTR
jgi:hypothetical protein